MSDKALNPNTRSLEPREQQNAKGEMWLCRNFSASKLKPVLCLSLIARSLSGPSLYLLSQTSGPQPLRNQSKLLLFSDSFSSQSQQKLPSSIPSTRLSLTRDGNYEEATPTNAVCPGCGVHIQDWNPKHPGFFTSPSAKDPGYKSRAHLVRTSLFETDFSGSLKKGIVIEDEPENVEADLVMKKPEKPIVCARCHSLRHYGKVKDPTGENLLPDFDFDHTVGKRLASIKGTRSVVLMAVDAVDFDGSFPRKVAKLVSETIEENYTAWKEGKSGNVPRMVLVVTKIDLLPSSLSPTRFEHWVRQRAREQGAVKITKVHFVSAVRNWGLKDLVEDVVGLAGSRGNVWAVGAQNAGKSTLLNAIAKCVGEGRAISHLTEAPVPGTTLGIVRVDGVLPVQAKLFDTPGLLHPHQITTRLNREEQKLVHISKELKPRTYRIKAGHTVHIGGLMRLDIEESSVETVYVTVWASPLLPLHMGKTEKVATMMTDHFGSQLQPPIGEKRAEELGQWVRHEFRVSGNTWDSSSVDIAAAGLGWFAIGLKGEAVLGVWTYEGVDVVLRNSLIPYRSQIFEESGFTVSKIVAKADQALNKSLRESKKKKKSKDPKAAFPAELPRSTVEAGSNSC